MNSKITENKKSLFNKYIKIILIYLIIFRNILIINFFQKLELEHIKSEILLVQETIKKIANVFILI